MTRVQRNLSITCTTMSTDDYTTMKREDYRKLWTRVCRCNPETLGIYISHVQYT